MRHKKTPNCRARQMATSQRKEKECVARYGRAAGETDSHPISPVIIYINIIIFPLVALPVLTAEAAGGMPRARSLLISSIQIDNISGDDNQKAKEDALSVAAICCSPAE